MNKNCDKTKFASNIPRESFKPGSKIRDVNLHRNLTSNSTPLPLFKNEMDREYFHWGATTEIMEIIRR